MNYFTLHGQCHSSARLTMNLQSTALCGSSFLPLTLKVVLAQPNSSLLRRCQRDLGGLLLPLPFAPALLAAPFLLAPPVASSSAAHAAGRQSLRKVQATAQRAQREQKTYSWHRLSHQPLEAGARQTMVPCTSMSCMRN
jgi:hypothetical protein